MKKLYTLVAAVLLTASLWAQAPQKFSYQAVIRNASSALVVNQKVGVRISVLQTSASGVSVYSERHEPTTNDNGLIAIEIGGGTVTTGEFTKIDWSKGPFYVRTETDPTGGTNYTISGESQLLSVPYALFAANSIAGEKGPKGDTGAVGPQGTAGVPGKDGLNGKDGIDGAVGPIGPKGDTGAVGPQGTAGLPGKDGVNGIDGKDGAIGPIGPKGDTGAVGPQGPAGKDGLNGKDGTNGNDGAIGSIGPKGDKGDKGMDGKVEFQNLRVSATGDTLYLTNGNFVIIPGLSTANENTNPQNPTKTPTSGSGQNVTDFDGNIYKTVYIGTQQWMTENLKTTKYSDGSPIPNVSDETEWLNLTTGAWSYYNNDIIHNNKYGKLYNWFAGNPSTNGNKNLCPSGWHVPSDSEWSVLIDYLGGREVAGGKMKEVGTEYWLDPNTGATNESGFSGLPGGYRNADWKNFPDMRSTGGWWSVTEATADYGRVRSIGYNDAATSYETAWSKKHGASVRCMRDANINTIDCGSATNNGTLTANSSAKAVSSILAYTAGNGGVHYGQIVNSTGVTGLTAELAASNFVDGNGTLTYNISGTPSSSGTATFAINIGGKSCNLNRIVGASIQEPTPTNGQNIIDNEGNSYKTVVIGTQTWMAQNLNVSKYNDGTAIPNIIDDNQWHNSSEGAYCHYNNDTPMSSIYGKLYNWHVTNPTVNGNKNVCPTGWHVPSDPEWIILSDYLGGLSVAGGKMKQEGTTIWYNPNVDASNSSLFTALPAGVRDNTGGYYYITSSTHWWSSTTKGDNEAYYRSISSGTGDLTRTYYSKNNGHSIRCIKD
jgi:uncharacterized protein (TIGR02145 family)